MAANSHDLTARQLAVLHELARGNSHKQAGFHLGLSSRTIEIHSINLRHALGAKNIPDAVRIAMLRGLLPREP